MASFCDDGNRGHIYAYLLIVFSCRAYHAASCIPCEIAQVADDCRRLARRLADISALCHCVFKRILRRNHQRQYLVKCIGDSRVSAERSSRPSQRCDCSLASNRDSDWTRAEGEATAGIPSSADDICGHGAHIVRAKQRLSRNRHQPDALLSTRHAVLCNPGVSSTAFDSQLASHCHAVPAGLGIRRVSHTSAGHRTGPTAVTILCSWTIPRCKFLPTRFRAPPVRKTSSLVLPTVQ